MINKLSNLPKLEKKFHLYLCLYSALVLLAIVFFSYTKQELNSFNKNNKDIAHHIATLKKENSALFHKTERNQDIIELNN